MSLRVSSSLAAIRAACQQALKTVEAGLNQVNDKINAATEREFVVPPLPEYSPLQETVTDQQRNLLAYFNYAGVFGLSYCMQKIAESEIRRQREKHDARPRSTPQLESIEVEQIEEEKEEGPIESQDTEPESSSDTGSEYAFDAASESVTSAPRRPSTRHIRNYNVITSAGSRYSSSVASQDSQDGEETIGVRDGIDPPSSVILPRQQSDEEKSDRRDTSIPPSSQSLLFNTGNNSAQKSWQLIIDDATRDKRLITSYYAATLPEELTRALIVGDLPRRMQDDGFRKKMQPYVEMKDSQGTYCVYVARGTQVGSSTQDAEQKNAGTGTSLTLREIMQVYDDIKLYIDVESSQSSRLAKKIDEVRHNSSEPLDALDYRHARRYGSGGGHDKFAHHKQWLRWLKRHYYDWAKAKLNTMEDHLLDIPIRRCFCYVGLSARVQRRAPEHWKTRSSRVFQLFLAVLKHRFGSKFTVTPFTYQIMHTVHKSHVGIDEKITTLICGAYTWHGGLSIVHAGIHKGRQSKRPTFEDNLEFMANTDGLVSRNFAAGAEKSRKFRRNIGQVLSMPDYKRFVLEQLEEHKTALEAAVVEVKTALDSMVPSPEYLRSAAELYAAQVLHQFLRQKYRIGQADTADNSGQPGTDI